eukprot:TRINITY_DN4596_c0_g1_i1.p1 TRINITY_DN4596_c0_g1~~TRINITY_DN4596_c0_g1_i1.p1  ORF type:complete len:760 (+),score=272.86 TRINITY_DN4596_c0_g1_i1:94-2373(+)
MAEKKKSLLLDSWKVFEALFQKKTNQTVENNLSLLIEAWILSDTHKLMTEGYVVLEGNKEGGKIIFQLDDFQVNTAYVSEKGHRILRTSESELSVADNIRMSIPERVDKPVVRSESDPNLSATFSLSTAKTTLEFFGKKRISSGFLFQGTCKEHGTVLAFDLAELELGATYRYEYPEGHLMVSKRKKEEEEIFIVIFHSTSCSPFDVQGLQNSLSNTNGIISDAVMARSEEAALFDSILEGANGKLSSNSASKEAPKRRSIFNWKRRKLSDIFKLQIVSTPEKAPSTPSNKRLRNGESRNLSSPGEVFTPSKKEEPQKDLIEFDEDNSNESEGGVPPPPPPPSAPAPPPPPGMGIKAKGSPRKKMRTLQWTPLPDSKLKSTVWSKLKEEGQKEESNSNSNIINDKELVALFSLSPTKKNTKNAPTNLTKNVSLLDIKRSNNIAILLSHFKMSFSDIREAIYNMDEVSLDLDKLIALQSMLPNDDERRQLKGFKGDVQALAAPERFLLEMCQLSSAETRVEFFLFKLRLPSDLKAITENISCIASASDELQQSQKFAMILKLVLGLGAILNEGTYLSSHGFKLDGLLRLAETKARDNKTTLLNYLSTLVLEKAPELVTFTEDIPNVEGASQIPLDVLVPELKEINNSMEKLQGILSSFSSSDKQSDPFYKLMNSFVETFKPDVNEANKILSDTLTSVSSCASYFGEEGVDEKSSKRFFSTVNTFSTSFERALKEVEEQKKKSAEQTERRSLRSLSKLLKA